LCFTALGQNAAEWKRCEDFEEYRHLGTAVPRSPNGPLRKDNITDEDVREVQRAALEVYPDSIVSISAVTDGCDCEDGGKCTAQVWLAVYRESLTRSLVLSKIDGHWKVGALQRWWLVFNAHQSIVPGFGRSAQRVAWDEENQRLLDSFPTCPTPPADWMLVRSESYGSTCVDTSSIQVSGFVRRANIRRMLPPPKVRPGNGWIRYNIDRVAFDCKDHRTRTDERVAYFIDGAAREQGGDDPVRWNPVRPDTETAADLDLVCGWDAKRQ
jgi:hypothetical protein